MTSNAGLRAALASACILIAGLLVDAYARSFEVAALRDQLARIDRHDRAAMEMAAASAIERRASSGAAIADLSPGSASRLARDPDDMRDH